MSARATKPKVSPPASRWRLWIDGCGGFLLLIGDRWSVGGLSDRARADVCVRADWPRRAGMIERHGSDYFWIQVTETSEHRCLLRGETPLPVEGSARLTLNQPSPLCDSAVLKLSPPHRFDEHIDGVILVNETMLIGPSSDCHIQYPESSDRAVLTRRDDRWLAKSGLAGDFEELRPGRRTMLRSLAMTLEQA